MLPNDTDASLPVLQSLPPEVGLILQSLPFCVGARDIPAFLESISANLRIRKYSPSDVVIHHGDQPKAMFFVIKGVLKVTSEDSEVDIAELGPGAFCKLLFDLVGEIAVLFDIKRVATVVAKTGCSLAILLAEDLIPALVNHPDIELNMRAAAKSRIRVMHEEYTRLGKVFQSALFQFEDADQESDSDYSADIGPISIDISPGRRASELLFTDLGESGLGSPSSNPNGLLNAIKVMPAALSVTAGLMRQQNGGRKLSIAPWADSTLLHFNALNQARPKESRLGNSRKSADSLVKSEYSLSPATSFLSTIGPTIEAAISDSPFSSLESRLRAKIYNKLDTKTKLRLLRLDHTTHRLLLLGGHGIFGTVDLSPWKKELTNELLGYITNLLANADIHKLVLHGCWQVNDAGLVIVAQNIPAIEHLDLNSAWDITDTGIASVAANCKRILSLDLSNCRKISSAGMLMVLEAASTLQNVQLSYCKSLNDDMMLHKTWASLLKANFQRCTGIFDKGFAHWVTIQTTLSQPFAMLDLCLSDCTYLTDESIVAIASTCPSLQNLNLSFCCSLSEQSMAILAKQCRSLECLDASYCGNAITDYSLDLLSSLPRLKILSIRGCVQATVSGLESFPSDTNINFSQCRGIPSDYKRV